MDANGLTPEETVPASCKLGRDEALALASEVKTIIAAKGKRVTTHWAFVEQLRERVAALPGVEAVALTSQTPPIESRA